MQSKDPSVNKTISGSTFLQQFKKTLFYKPLLSRQYPTIMYVDHFAIASKGSSSLQ